MRYFLGFGAVLLAVAAFVLSWLPTITSALFGVALSGVVALELTLALDDVRRQQARRVLCQICRDISYRAIVVLQRNHASFDPLDEWGGRGTQVEGEGGTGYRGGGYAEDYELVPSAPALRMLHGYLEDMRVIARRLRNDPNCRGAILHDSPAFLPLLERQRGFLDGDPFRWTSQALLSSVSLAGDHDSDELSAAITRVLSSTIQARAQIGYARAGEGNDLRALDDWLAFVDAIEDLLACAIAIGWPEELGSRR